MNIKLIIVLVISQKTLDEHQKRYSTIEKETVGLVFALNHFDVYLNPTVVPILV